jgi:hypothetical protein
MIAFVLLFNAASLPLLYNDHHTPKQKECQLSCETNNENSAPFPRRLAVPAARNSRQTCRLSRQSPAAVRLLDSAASLKLPAAFHPRNRRRGNAGG